MLSGQDDGPVDEMERPAVLAGHDAAHGGAVQRLCSHVDGREEDESEKA